MKNIIRILELSVKNIKNLKMGKITFDSYNQVINGDFDFTTSDIIGIYGQNGSSKSALINSLGILKSIISHNSLQNNIFNLISHEEMISTLSMKIYFNNNEEHYIFDYTVDIKKDTKDTKENSVFIDSETLTYRKYENDVFTKKKTIFKVERNPLDLMKFITPLNNLKLLTNNSNNIFPMLLMLKGKKEEGNCSFIFSEEFVDILKLNNEFSFVIDFINMINSYALHNLHLFDNRDITKMMALDKSPIFLEDNNSASYLSLFNEGILNNEFKEKLDIYTKEINTVLSKLIPGIVIGYVNLGSTLNEMGKNSFKYQFVSKKNNQNIPLYMESDGIKKIIAITSSLIDAFNNPSSILVIDEFDSGIFEYLLGIILDVFKNKGVGQLLFTSHNLRALEVIKDDIVFTTNDDNNRFIRLPYIQNTNNLRKKYLRDLYLGSDYNLSNQTDEYEIYRALKEAGELYLYEKEK